MKSTSSNDEGPEIKEFINQGEENPAGGPGLGGLPCDGQPYEPG